MQNEVTLCEESFPLFPFSRLKWHKVVITSTDLSKHIKKHKLHNLFLRKSRELAAEATRKEESL